MANLGVISLWLVVRTLLFALQETIMDRLLGKLWRRAQDFRVMANLGAINLHLADKIWCGVSLD